MACAPHPEEADGNVQAEEKAGECFEPMLFKLTEAMNPIPTLGVPQQNAEDQSEIGDED